MTNPLEKPITTLLLQLQAKKGYVLADSIEDLAKKLAKGYAVDSIFHQPNDNELNELRVWFEDYELVTPDGPIASHI